MSVPEGHALLSPGTPSRLLWPFRPLVTAPPPCDLQMLMAYPFFSLAKTPRFAPIRFQAGRVTTRVAGTLANGMATIWDADVLIWVTSQIVGARNAGLPTSQRVVATPFRSHTARPHTQTSAGRGRAVWPAAGRWRIGELDGNRALMPPV